MLCALAPDAGLLLYPNDIQTHLIRWDTLEKDARLWQAHHKLRHDIFIRRHQWSVPHYDDCEFDRYDNSHATYVIVEKGGECVACVRVIPTNCPYMLEEAFSDLLPSSPPKTSTICEVTRLGIKQGIEPRIRQLVFLHLLNRLFQLALDIGVEKFLILTPTRMIGTIYAPNGIPVNPYSDHACRMGNLEAVAAEISISEMILDGILFRINCLLNQ